MKSVKKAANLLFHKYKSQLIFADIIISIIIFILIGIFKPDYVIIAAFFLIMPYLILTQRKLLLKQLFLAFILSLTWVFLAKSYYGYNQTFATILGINLYPLFAWATSLFLIYVLVSHYEHLIKKINYIKQLLFFIIFYWPLLIAGETIAYHLFNIHNVATAVYSGLPICNCIHAPIWMQTVYFLMGPIYLTLLYLLKLKNPHLKKSKTS